MRRYQKIIAMLLVAILFVGILPLGALAKEINELLALTYTLNSESVTLNSFEYVGPGTASNVVGVYVASLPAGAELTGFTHNSNQFFFIDKKARNPITTDVSKAEFFVNDEFLSAGNTAYSGYQTNYLDAIGEETLSMIPTKNVRTVVVRVSDSGAYSFVFVQISTGSTPSIELASAQAKPGQTVTVPVTMANSPEFAGLQATVSYDKEALTLTGAENVQLKDFVSNTTTGDIQASDTTNYTAEGTLFNLTFKVNESAALGEYPISLDAADGMDGAILMDANANPVSAEVKSGTITVVNVTDEDLAAGYNVVMDADKTVNVGDVVPVAVDVIGKGVDAKNYTNFTMSFRYDSSRLTFKGLSGLTNDDQTTTDKYEVTYKDGVITVYKYGTEKAVADSDFTLNFTAKESGKATVTCTSAKLGTQASAWDQNEAVANIADKDTVITIISSFVNVSKPADVNGADTAEKGKDYSFTLTDPDANYNYAVEAEVNGEKVTVNGPDADGTYTIPGSAVTGDITITVSKTPKTYEVTVSGQGAGDITLPDDKPTYGNDYAFTLNAEDDYDYEVTVTINGQKVTVTGPDADGTYTIPGAQITGPVTIAVSKTVAAPVSINFVGTGAGQVAGGANQSTEIGKDFTFTVTEDREYYDYTVTAKDGDTVITLADPVDNGDGTYTYTIPGSAIKKGSSITVTVTETRNLHVQMLASEYVKMDGSIAVLYRATAKLKADERLAMNLGGFNYNFFHTNEDTYKTGLDNAEDGVWCFVSWGDTSNSAAFLQEEANQRCSIMVARTGALDKYVIDFDNDVNLTDTVDTNDAQLVWNMYNAKYRFDMSDYDMQKRLLEANTNHNDLVINVLDSRSIVASLLG